jgi:hypothetical protein
MPVVNEPAVEPVEPPAVPPDAVVEEPVDEPSEVPAAPWDPAYDKDEFHLLGSNTPPPSGRKQRRTAFNVFGPDAAMRLLPTG